MSQFTLIFPDRHGQGRLGRLRFPWVKGKPLRQYLKDPQLKEYALTAFSLRCKMYNGKKAQVHLAYMPPENDFVVLVSSRS